jgi:NAD(P)-dependent dehydrogenase (short-subunit alcohol dehydrogenase family)
MLQSKICVISGSSAGIGATTAVKFAQEKAEGLVLHGRQDDKLKLVKNKCVQAGMAEKNVLIVVGDIKEASVREKICVEAIKCFSRIDVLVNNAGIFDHKSFLESDLDLFDEVFNINVRSVVALTKLCVPHIIATKGNIINVSATLGIRSQSWACFYNMSKAALDHFTRCLSLELASLDVRVNSVNPGYVSDTEIVTRTGAPQEVLTGIEEQTKKSHPLHRSGKPEEVAEAIVWLVGKATFTTGHCLTIDGGFSIA